MARSLSTQLMFEGRAEEAIELYVSLFDDAEVVAMERYGAGGQGADGAEGTVKRADLRIAGRDLIFIDSPIEHPFTFTPSVSLFVECDDEAEQERLVEALSEDGEQPMPLDDYGFSRRFAWVLDRFGVSWQLNLS